MNKAKLVAEAGEQTGLTKKASWEAVDAVTPAVSDCLGRGEIITLVGFATFQIIQRKVRGS